MFKGTESRDIRAIAVKSSAIAFLLLLTLAVAGNLLFTELFHVELYSLKVAGGIVLFYMGFRAVDRGVFFEVRENQRLEDLSIVPLASPLIAGPATITAVLSFSLDHGLPVASAAMAVAVAANLLFMLASRRIGSFLLANNLMGALIRITGLVVTTIAVQMILSGVGDWFLFL